MTQRSETRADDKNAGLKTGQNKTAR